METNSIILVVSEQAAATHFGLGFTLGIVCYLTGWVILVVRRMATGSSEGVL